MSLNIKQLLNIRKEVIDDFRKQKHRFTNDIDFIIGKELRALRDEEGYKVPQLQVLIGSKDYRTLKHYLDHEGDMPLPKRMDELPRGGPVDQVSPKRTGGKPITLTDHLNFFPQEGKVVAVNVPANAWTDVAREERPDLFPVADGYNGWAYWDEEGRITKKSETKSPLLGENLFGVLTPALLKEKANAQD